jgi:hypothetical protein
MQEIGAGRACSALKGQSRDRRSFAIPLGDHGAPTARQRTSRFYVHGKTRLTTQFDETSPVSFRRFIPILSFVPSLAKLSFDILAAVKHMQNLHVLILDGVDNHVMPDGKAAQSGAQIVAGATHARILA